MLKTIFNDFIQLILFLNDNQKLLKEEKKNAIYLDNKSKINEILTPLEQKVSDNFKKLCKDNDSFIICKTSYLFEFYRDLIFRKVKFYLKEFQSEINFEGKIGLIEECFNKQKLITKKEFKSAIRAFIILFLNLENDKENNIKGNENNLINYLDIPDIWNKAILINKNFHNELNNLKNLDIRINQTIPFYDCLGEDIDDNYFMDIKKAIEQEEEIKKIKEKQEPDIDEQIPSEESSDTSYNKDSDSEDNGDRDFV